MKKSSKLLILAFIGIAVLISSCSLSLGFPWLAGGWGVEIGTGFTGWAASSRAAGDQFTMTLDQDGGAISGFITLNGNDYELKGMVDKSGNIVINTVVENEQLVLEGKCSNDELKGNEEAWSAKRLAN